MRQRYLAAYLERDSPPGNEFSGGISGKNVRNLSISKYRAGHAQKRGSGETQALFGRTGRMYSIRQKCRGRDRGQGNRRSDQSFSGNTGRRKPENIVRRYFWAEPVKELAGNLNISEGKVKSQLFRMRAKLKMHLEKEGIAL